MPSYTGAPANVIEARRAAIQTRANLPSTEQIHIRYGMITAVNQNNLVQVKLLNEKGLPEGSEIAEKTFLPINTPLSVILLQFGPLRPGLICRIFWKGKILPDAGATIDVIGDEEHQFLIKDPYPTEIQVGPFKIFSGGMM